MNLQILRWHMVVEKEREREGERERGKKRKEKKERKKERQKERELTLFLLDLSTAPMLGRDFGKAEAGGPIISLLSIHSHPLSADQFQAIMLDSVEGFLPALGVRLRNPHLSQ